MSATFTPIKLPFSQRPAHGRYSTIAILIIAMVVVFLVALIYYKREQIRNAVVYATIRRLMRFNNNKITKNTDVDPEDTFDEAETDNLYRVMKSEPFLDRSYGHTESLVDASFDISVPYMPAAKLQNLEPMILTGDQVYNEQNIPIMPANKVVRTLITPIA